MVTVYGSDASARATPNSAWIAGSTTVTEYMPEPPIVISNRDTARRSQAYGVSVRGGDGKAADMRHWTPA